MANLEELEETVADLQREVSALRELVKLLLLKLTEESPDVLKSMAVLLASVYAVIGEDGYSEHVKDEVERILTHAQHLADVIASKAEP